MTLPTKESPMDASPARDKIRVLLVDDCVAVRDLYEMALGGAVEVETAGRGDEALALAVRHPPDVIVLDIMMPGLDGWEVCERLRSNPRTAAIPVIMLTSDDRPEVAVRGRMFQTSVLGKPCPAEKLLGTIRSAMPNLMDAQRSGRDV
jgi:two-component system cell cycle response regulator